MPARAARGVTLILVVVAVASTAVAIGLVASTLPSLAPKVTPVQGQGDVVAEDRTTGSFHHVSVAAGLKVVIGTDSATSVTLEAQPNLLAMITTTVKDDQLVVEAAAPGFASAEPVTLTIRMPALDSIALSAGATGTVEDMGGTLTVDVSGGAIEALTVTASSGATAMLGELLAGSAAVTLGGGSVVELHVTGTVTGTADGGATLTFTEKPASVKITTSGGASVQGG
jgi:hypothetical protein